MTEWQPIETAPKDGTRILLAHHQNKYENLPPLIWVIDGQWGANWRTGDDYQPHWHHDRKLRLVSPTHWMPLPEPPK